MLKVSNLNCERDYRLLIDNLSFELREGEVLWVEGPNGSGKSTLLRILSGLFQDYEGQVERDLNEPVLYLGHAPGVKDNLTAIENLHWLVTLGTEDTTEYRVEKSTLEKALATVGLAGFEDVFCGSLSAGQRKRVNLARLFVLRTQLWILDEPFSAIDVSGVDALQQCMAEHVGRGGTLIMTSHQTFDFGKPPRVVTLGGGN